MEKTKLAVIEVSGKQHLVRPGSTILIETSSTAKLKLTDLLSGKPVEAEVTELVAGPKVRIVKFRSKTRELKRRGYRAKLGRLKVTKIG